MSLREFRCEVLTALAQIRLARLGLVLLFAIAAALLSDALRDERVIFPAPLPKFTTLPKTP